MTASAFGPLRTSSPTGRDGLVLTSVGPDRPGLVNRIAQLVGKVGGNIEDTRMAKLGGEFAVLMLVTGTDNALAALEADKGRLEAELGLTFFLKRTRSPEPKGATLVYTLTVSALDRPGIVESVSLVLVGRQINVASLSSRVEPAPLTGSPLFELTAELHIPADVPLVQLRRELDEAAERENIDYALRPGRS